MLVYLSLHLLDKTGFSLCHVPANLCSTDRLRTSYFCLGQPRGRFCPIVLYVVVKMNYLFFFFSVIFSRCLIIFSIVLPFILICQTGLPLVMTNNKVTGASRPREPQRDVGSLEFVEIGNRTTTVAYMLARTSIYIYISLLI